MHIILGMVALVQIPSSFESNVARYEQTSKFVQDILNKMGLTQNESKIYLYLNENGSKKAIEISQNQKIHRTQTYHLLETLQNKGMITVIYDRITKFERVEFQKVLDIFINNELKRIEELQIIRNKMRELWNPNF